MFSKELVADAEAVENFVVALLRADRICPAALGFDHLVRGRENAVAGGMAGIEPTYLFVVEVTGRPVERWAIPPVRFSRERVFLYFSACLRGWQVPG